MEVYFITGVMGAGKSRKLIEDFNNDDSEKIALAGTVTKETGEEGFITSRNGDRVNATYLNKEQINDVLFTVLYLITVYKVKHFYIDEVQFLSKESVFHIIELAKSFDVTVYFYGISTDFRGLYFESTKYLLEQIPIENVTEIFTFCETKGCFNVAKYNARFLNGKMLTSGETFTEEKSIYVSICEKCYKENLKE